MTTDKNRLKAQLARVADIGGALIDGDSGATLSELESALSELFGSSPEGLEAASGALQSMKDRLARLSKVRSAQRLERERLISSAVEGLFQ